MLLLLLTALSWADPKVEVQFSPNQGSRERLIQFVDSCDTHLYVAAYSLTADPIADAIIRAKDRGLDTKVLVDNTQAGSKYAQDERLLESGVALRRDLRSAAMHNKFIVCDWRHVLTGSYNFTNNAEFRNDENYVIIHFKYVAIEYGDHFLSLWAKNDPESE